MFNPRKREIIKLLKSIKVNELCLFIDPEEKYRLIILSLGGGFTDLSKDTTFNKDLLHHTLLGISNSSQFDNDILNNRLKEIMKIFSKHTSLLSKKVYVFYPEKYDFNREFILNSDLENSLILNFKY